MLKTALATGVTLSTWPLPHPPALWGAEAGQPKRGGILRVRGYDPTDFDPHLTISVKTHTTLSFVSSKLVTYKVGTGVQPGTFTVEPDLTERWEALDDTTYVFRLRKGVKWHNKPSPSTAASWWPTISNLPMTASCRKKAMRTAISWNPWTGSRWWTAIQPPFNDVRVRRAISHAIDRQGLIDAVWGRGEPTPAVARGLVEWSLPVDQLGAGAKYYQYDPQKARRLPAEAGYPHGFQTPLTATPGLGRDLIDEVQLIQRDLNDVGIEVESKLQEFGAYTAITFAGKDEGMVRAPYGIAWEFDGVLYRTYAPDSANNLSHVNDPHAHGDAQGTTAHEGSGGAQENHF